LLTGERVKRVLERLRASRGLPEVILSDNGPEFTGHVLDQWADDNKAGQQFMMGRANHSSCHRE
jgi:putative transposase